MQAERAPFVGIVLAILVLCVETVALVAYAQDAAPTTQTHSLLGVRHCQK